MFEMLTRAAQLTGKDWLCLFRGWRDAEAKCIVGETEVETLARYMPYIVDIILNGEGFFWFPYEMTPEQCVQQQMQQYDSLGATPSGWVNFMNYLSYFDEEE